MATSNNDVQHGATTPLIRGSEEFYDAIQRSANSIVDVFNEEKRLPVVDKIFCLTMVMQRILKQMLEDHPDFKDDAILLVDQLMHHLRGRVIRNEFV